MSTYLRIGEVAKALGVSVDTLRRWETAGKVTFERENGRRVLRADALEELATTARSSANRSSARNRLTGTVIAVKRDGVMAQVEMLCGDFRILSLMSREAADDLELEPGVAVAAVVKATNVVVER